MKARELLCFFLAVTLDPCGSRDLFFPAFFSYHNSNNEQLIIGRYDEDVILPCLFTSESEIVIHWEIQDNIVHSYFNGMDQFERQYPRFANRTSLFHSEIHNGNASLTVRRLSLLDEGIYTCYVGTRSRSTVNKVVLKVGAFHTPLMKYEKKNTESFLVCSILSVYPLPRITWKMDNADVSEGSTEVTGSPGPFCVKSTLNITGSNSSFECVIENSLLNQTWRGQWTLAGSHWMTQSESISLWCRVSSNFSLQNQDFHVNWSKGENVLDWHLNSAQNRTANDRRFSQNKELRSHSAFPITLKYLNPSDSGEYLCNVSSTEHTLLTVHRLHVVPSQVSQHLGICVSLSLLMVLAICYCIWIRKSTDSEEMCVVVIDESDNPSGHNGHKASSYSSNHS
ncbi:HERV-H LTR-associating protein 2 [Onychomys torridus]|uniref:HERV-H LTR-associating protein 2 n=1 Tax=Onychomys torridus TaxID=38674 RepID=UPI00167F6F34|nr:HERV-H LTR-associating protein 2 [Onychomys torridus]